MVRQKAGLNRTVLDQGWFAFRTMARKLAARVGRLVAVEPPPTSPAREACGQVGGGSRNGLPFVCVGRGHAAQAGVHAAGNVPKRARGTRLSPVEGCHGAPVEAGTAVAIAA